MKLGVTVNSARRRADAELAKLATRNTLKRALALRTAVDTWTAAAAMRDGPVFRASTGVNGLRNGNCDSGDQLDSSLLDKVWRSSPAAYDSYERVDVLSEPDRVSIPTM